MNTYLVPFSDDETCDIFKVYANSWEACEAKIMSKYITKFDADDLAVIDDFESFCNHLYETYNVYIGVIHEIEDFE